MLGFGLTFDKEGVELRGTSVLPVDAGAVIVSGVACAKVRLYGASLKILGLGFKGDWADQAGNAIKELNPANPIVPASFLRKRLLLPFIGISFLLG